MQCSNTLIQIQPMLRLNASFWAAKEFACIIQIQPMLRLNAEEHYKGRTPEYIDSNTTNVKVKLIAEQLITIKMSPFKYNQC